MLRRCLPSVPRAASGAARALAGGSRRRPGAGGGGRGSRPRARWASPAAGPGRGSDLDQDRDRDGPPPPPPPPRDGATAPLAASLVASLPPGLRPYAHLARLDRPVGSLLLLWPCAWSTALAAPPGCLPDGDLLALFAAGSLVMRGAGCTINDMWDAGFDREVERTRDRPLASGAVTHRQAGAFLAAQLAAGLGVLCSLPHLEYTFLVGAASLPLVAVYPLMKRVTDYPQVVLGLTFNWGTMVGWAAVHGSIDWGVVGPLYGAGVAWTLVYDTLYAHQDKADDARLGLKSTALTFGDGGTRTALYGLTAAALAGWGAAGWACGVAASPLYCGGCAAAAAHLVWQVRTADLDDPANLAERFRSNNQVGALVFASCVAGNLAMAPVLPA